MLGVSLLAFSGMVIFGSITSVDGARFINNTRSFRAPAAYINSVPVWQIKPVAPIPPQDLMCPMNVKRCPDGSYKPRTGARCEFASCGGQTSAVITAPSIYSLNPSTGPKGTLVTMYGNGFTPTGNRIKFGNLGSEQNPRYNINSSDGTTLTFTVPYSSYSSCLDFTPRCLIAQIVTRPGNYQVSVLNANGNSNAVTFSVVAK